MVEDGLEDIMAAAAFAEGGEPEMARGLLNEKRRVLLAVTAGSLNDKLVGYAVNACGRSSAILDALFVAGRDTTSFEIHAAVRKLERAGARIVIVRRDEDLKDAIINYTRKRREIQFVIIGDEPEGKTLGLSDRDILGKVLGKMKCPLVVVTRGDATQTA